MKIIPPLSHVSIRNADLHVGDSVAYIKEQFYHDGLGSHYCRYPSWEYSTVEYISPKRTKVRLRNGETMGIRYDTGLYVPDEKMREETERRKQFNRYAEILSSVQHIDTYDIALLDGTELDKIAAAIEGLQTLVDVVKKSREELAEKGADDGNGAN